MSAKNGKQENFLMLDDIEEEGVVEVTLNADGTTSLSNIECGDKRISLTIKEMGWGIYQKFLNASGKDAFAMVDCYAETIDSWSLPGSVTTELLQQNEFFNVCIEIDKAIKNYGLPLIRFKTEKGLLPEISQQEQASDRAQEIYEAKKNTDGTVEIYDAWVRGKDPVFLKIKALGWKEYDEIKQLVTSSKTDIRALIRAYSSIIAEWSLDEPVTAVALTKSNYFHLCMILDQVLKIFFFRRTKSTVVNNRRAKKNNIRSKRQEL